MGSAQHQPSRTSTGGPQVLLWQPRRVAPGDSILCNRKYRTLATEVYAHRAALSQPVYEHNYSSTQRRQGTQNQPPLKKRFSTRHIQKIEIPPALVGFAAPASTSPVPRFVVKSHGGVPHSQMPKRAFNLSSPLRTALLIRTLLLLVQCAL